MVNLFYFNRELLVSHTQSFQHSVAVFNLFCFLLATSSLINQVNLLKQFFFKYIKYAHYSPSLSYMQKVNPMWPVENYIYTNFFLLYSLKLFYYISLLYIFFILRICPYLSLFAHLRRFKMCLHLNLENFLFISFYYM